MGQSGGEALFLPRLGGQVFLGEYNHTLDNKGRLTLPARWRDELGDSVVVTRGLDQCLFLFPATVFEGIAQEINSLGFSKSDARALSRYLFAKATADAPDKQGRIILQPELREFADIDGDAVILGAANRIEIWNAQRYAELNAKIEASAEEISERFGDLLQKALNKIKE